MGNMMMMMSSSCALVVMLVSWLLHGYCDSCMWWQHNNAVSATNQI
jgi:hypothetical protein